eukprot:TRINITY_DN28434_c0_g1_i1.p1 TRINITY_DN28434_c0_g1~~TRINITY_DN28434_c0_g1_i1.p1  ORF type:complete len:538 (+),score=64.47 TRINITY_DN28434_c0_g1_i1:153-1766(+)
MTRTAAMGSLTQKVAMAALAFATGLLALQQWSGMTNSTARTTLDSQQAASVSPELLAAEIAKHLDRHLASGGHISSAADEKQADVIAAAVARHLKPHFEKLAPGMAQHTPGTSVPGGPNTMHSMPERLDPMSEDEQLEGLFYKQGTDKSRDDHHYSTLYTALVAPRKSQVAAILELGIDHGQSVAVWGEFLPHARVVGIDRNIHDGSRRKVKDFTNVELLHCANAQDVAQVSALGLPKQGFDLVIDDSDHSPDGELRALAIWWDFVKPGGYYVTEDIYEDATDVFHSVDRAKKLNPQVEPMMTCSEGFFVKSRFGHRALMKPKSADRRSGWLHNLNVLRKPHSCEQISKRGLSPNSIIYETLFGAGCPNVARVLVVGSCPDCSQQFPNAVVDTTDGELASKHQLYYDIVIDRGPPAPEHQQNRLLTLWPAVASMGVYFIEGLTKKDYYSVWDSPDVDKPCGIVKPEVWNLVRLNNAFAAWPKVLSSEQASHHVLVVQKRKAALPPVHVNWGINPSCFPARKCPENTAQLAKTWTPQC